MNHFSENGPLYFFSCKIITAVYESYMYKAKYSRDTTYNIRRGVSLKTNVSINTIISQSGFFFFFFFFLITGLAIHVGVHNQGTIMTRYFPYSLEIQANANKKQLLFFSISNDLNWKTNRYFWRVHLEWLSLVCKNIYIPTG